MATRTRRLVPVDRDRLDADAGIFADFLLAALEHVVVEEVDQLRRVGSALLELDAGIHVLGVLAEDDDVHLLGMLHRAGHALVVLHRPHAGVEVEDLAERHVERADAAADRRGQRSLDGDAQVAGGVDGVVGQPVVELAVGLFAGEDLEPLDASACRRRPSLLPRRRRAARPSRCRGRCRRLQ